MAGFLCPFCNQVIAINSPTFRSWISSFDSCNDPGHMPAFVGSGQIKTSFCKCPNCKEITIKVDSTEKNLPPFHFDIHPKSSAIQFPAYVPQAIRSDYEEACAIRPLSPKSCATLCRRCLQGMIHDFWNIHEKNLNAEITALRNKVSPTQWQVIDAVRALGNIGAHMEHDVNLIIDIDVDEAEKLIALIERLIQAWYIERYTEQQLFNDIIGINKAAQAKRS